MTDREKLIEAMARAIFGVFQQGRGSPRNWEHEADDLGREPWREEARAALSTLCDAIPGLADVIDGGAVIVPKPGEAK